MSRVERRKMHRIKKREGDTYVHTGSGYVFEKYEGKWKYQHRVVMERHLRRKLKKGEIVHHKNGDRGNNQISNLEVMTDRAHKLSHEPEQSRAHSIRMKVMFEDPEYYKRIAKANRNKIITPELRIKLSKAGKAGAEARWGLQNESS